MDDVTLAARALASLQAFYRSIGTHVPGARVLEPAPGVVATVVPRRPDSLANTVTYTDPETLLAVRDLLVRTYEAAGIDAWTVRTRPGDDELTRQLARSSHVPSGTRTSMSAALAQMDLESRVDLDLVPGADAELAGHINDAAYGIDPARGLATIFTGFHEPNWHVLVAQFGGEPAATVAWRAHNGDCGIYYVAAAPAARGRGLASELIRHALRDARREGCVTTSLQATAMSRSVYAHLGYRSLGTLEMWELRRPSTSTPLPQTSTTAHA